jgi:curved DNA-binding protein CbpA
VLGVEAAADTGAVRKAYWRLSLLVHPDKCAHPSAHEAFQAVSKAAKLLQDAEARKAHDAAAEDAALRKAALTAAAAAERQAAWATARGEAVPPEVAAQLAAARAAAAGPATRESWMTDLPPEKRPPSASDPLAGLTQVCGKLAWVSVWVSRLNDDKPGCLHA